MQSLTPKQLEVLTALSLGQSVTAAADSIGIHRTTVHHWSRTIPEFRHCLEAAKQSRIDIVRDQMHELTTPSIAILRNVIEDESASPALRIRTALSILKFVTATEKSCLPKETSAEVLMDISYAAGHQRGQEYAAETAAAHEAEPEIHHNSSLSSNEESEEQQTPRNALCPCGSKLKYKRCCGRNAPPVLTRAA